MFSKRLLIKIKQTKLFFSANIFYRIRLNTEQKLETNQIKVEVSIEMSTDELVDLLLAPCVQVLELVKIADDVQSKKFFIFYFVIH